MCEGRLRHRHKRVTSHAAALQPHRGRVASTVQAILPIPHASRQASIARATLREQGEASAAAFFNPDSDAS
jgi:hypothetical protein